MIKINRGNDITEYFENVEELVVYSGLENEEIEDITDFEMYASSNTDEILLNSIKEI